VRVDVDETDVGKVRLGSRAYFTTAAFGGSQILGPCWNADVPREGNWPCSSADGHSHTQGRGFRQAAMTFWR
jgi:hypothetical protein